ncbi:hypothetical protein PT974_05450 [Cladobotryum mycophilum]|uniref:Pathway-specific nitrogen regulator n=1 Tax=Cladobotryum mycophilum TaxID=491253 RepID=A0ABR0SIS4_9HYPO
MPRQMRHQDLDFDTDIRIDPRSIDPSASRRDTIYSTYSTGSMEDEHYASHHQERESARRPFVADGDNSSHHENEDDVFSDRSPRSSMGSMSSEADHDKMDARTRSPRISDIQQYDGEMDYVPTVKGTPRPPFRSPSSVKAMQMSSPTPSIMGTPRSGRRSAIPTVSRIGSPSLSAQYSPKKTPPRFKRNTPPLVLLHVTLLPLRWSWGDVLDNAQPSELSDEAKTLRESWRQLQDRNGDTIQDRGILLPHPQNDFEMLEERLLEALELPLQRRARILECGHYLGPSNIMAFSEETESEDDDQYDDDKSRRASLEKQTHWCNTCASDIRFDALGPGKVYRVKIYASNGLLKAGAWEACWKEMERVDVELEPMMDTKLQDELTRLAADQEKTMEQERSMHMQDHEDEEDIDDHVEPADQSHFDEHVHPDEDPIDREPFQGEEEEEHLGEESFMAQDNMNSPPQQDPYGDRQRMKEERWREMYGDTQHNHSTPRSSTGFVPQQGPPQPEGTVPAYKNATLPELAQEAFKSLMEDKKNILIILLTVLTVLVAVRGGGGGSGGSGGQPNNDIAFQRIVKEAPAMPAVQAVQEPADNAESSVVTTTSTSTVLEVRYTPIMGIQPADPCAAVQPHTVEKVKWMTETVTATPAATDAADAGEETETAPVEGEELEEETQAFTEEATLEEGEGIADEGVGHDGGAELEEEVEREL